MSMLEVVLLSGVIWFIICVTSFLFGYAHGMYFDRIAWSGGYDDGYRACKQVHQSQLDEEEYDLNV